MEAWRSMIGLPADGIGTTSCCQALWQAAPLIGPPGTAPASHKTSMLQNNRDMYS